MKQGAKRLYVYIYHCGEHFLKKISFVNLEPLIIVRECRTFPIFFVPVYIVDLGTSLKPIKGFNIEIQECIYESSVSEIYRVLCHNFLRRHYPKKPEQA